MSERPRKLRKTEHGSKVVDLDKEIDNEEIDKPGSGNADAVTPDQRKRSATDATTRKVDPPRASIKPKIEENKTGHAHRKRHAAPFHATKPKKLALSENPAPTSAETDAPDVDELLQRQVQNLNIGRSGDRRIQGAVPRSIPEILVVRDPSGYVIAQATFNVPRNIAPGGSGEAVAGGSGEAVAGRSGVAVAGGSGEAVAGGKCEVEPGEIPMSLPMIVIQAREERYAKIISQFNITIPEVDLHLAKYKYIVEVIPHYVEKKRLGLMSGRFFSSKSTDELKQKSLMESCYRLDCVHDILQKWIPVLKQLFDNCIRDAKLLWRIYPADNTSARPTHLTESARRLLRQLEVPLPMMIDWIDKCEMEVVAYNEAKQRLDGLREK